MVMALLVFVGGYWIARGLQPDAAARALFQDTTPIKRKLLAVYLSLGLVLALTAQAARIGAGAAAAWLVVIVVWVLVARAALARLVPQGALALLAADYEPARKLGDRKPQEAVSEPAIVAPRIDPQSPRLPESLPPPAPYAATPNTKRYRLHCRACDSVLTRPIREFHPQAATPGNFRYGATIRPGSSTRPSPVDVLPGEAREAYFLSAGVLDGAATPLTWDTRSEGCCGPEARGGPNVLCHGCGAWALFYNETCYSPTFFAGRPTEVELRECDPAERYSRPAPEHDKEHWRRVALEQPGVVDLSEVVDRVLEQVRPDFDRAGKSLEIGTLRGGAARIDPEDTFHAARLLLDHALEVAGGASLDATVQGRGVSMRIVCGSPVRSDAEETIPEEARRRARALGGQIHPWRFPDGDFQMVLEIPRDPIPLKPVRAG